MHVAKPRFEPWFGSEPQVPTPAARAIKLGTIRPQSRRSKIAHLWWGFTPRLRLVVLAVGLLTASTRGDAPVTPRAVYNFNPGWKLYVGDPPGAARPDFDDSGWKAVTLPRAWNEDDAFRVSIAEHSTGIAWYRKRFRLPPDATGRKVFLEFEGIRQAGEFYLNGRFIGRHENGVMAFGFDVTDLVKPYPEENILAVRTDNSWDYREHNTGTRFQWHDRNFNANYGGIIKNVKLHVTGRLYQTLPLYSFLGTVGQYIYATDFDLPRRTATVVAETEVRNETGRDQTVDLEVRLMDMHGNCVRLFSSGPHRLPAGITTNISARARVQGLNFWSWGYGYLYDVWTVLKLNGVEVDAVRTRTGFRKTEFGNGLIRLNGRVIQVKGYAQRTSNEWPAVGSCVPPWLSDFSNLLIVQGNGNLVRWMHVTPWKQDVESCDRVGLLQAMPAGDAEADARGRQWEQRLELMRDAIIYNRNNPSIIFYESGNKGISEEHMRQMKAIRDRYDPFGGRAIGCREMLDSTEAEYGGEMLYINKSARMPVWAMEYMRDEALRKYWDEFTPPFHPNGDGPPYRGAPAYEYNRNQDSYALEAVARWFDYWRERPGTGTRVSSGGVNIIFSDSNTHFRGAENYRRSGEVDAMRIPKDAYYAHQVMWDGWVEIERPRIYIVGHWNYTPGLVKNVYVISSAESVELFLNGRSLGYGIRTNQFQFTFPKIAWAPGVLRAVGYDARGRKLCETEKRTAGPAVAIRLTPYTHPCGLRADGADLALVEVEVVDAHGQRCPTNMNMINFELSGPAEWRGGIAQGPDNYILSTNLPVECGVNRVLIRSTTEPGTITLVARAEGLAPATLVLKSKPVFVTNGWSPDLPSDGLQPYLGRGPTPKGDSFKITRRPVRILRAEAGSNQESVALAFDDNERTSWCSDGRPGTAWIQLELERRTRIDELVLKLGGFRRRAYPLRVLVDGKEAFIGMTPRSLGYVTLPLKPSSGKTVRIELTGAADVNDRSGLIEVTGAQLQDTPEPVSRAALEIVELELYRTVASGRPAR